VIIVLLSFAWVVADMWLRSIIAKTA
jgi:hypothetical protein